MNETEKRPGARRLGFMVPLLLFVLFFVAACGVVAGVFIQSARMSTDAALLSDGVQLCRNQSEILWADARDEATFPRIDGIRELFFDENFRQTEAAGGKYRLTLTETRDGNLRLFTVTAHFGERQLYRLDTAVCLSEGR